MEYKSSIIRESFWLDETRQTARYMLEGITERELVRLSEEENIYQLDNESRSNEMARRLYDRLDGFDGRLLEYLTECDRTSRKILVFISIMRNDRLFTGFMQEVYKKHLLKQDHEIADREFMDYFDRKAQEIEKVFRYSPRTIERIISSYKQFLLNAGLLKTERDRYIITRQYIDEELEDLLHRNGCTQQIRTITI